MDYESLKIPDALLFEEVPCYISIQDKDCRIMKVNRKFRETFGDRRGDFCYAVYKQRDEKCKVCPMDMVYRDGTVQESEEVVFSPEGYPVHVIVNVAPIHDDKGNIVAVMEMATDITEAKRLQRQLEDSSEKYRMLYDEVPCYISVQDKNFRLIDINRQFKNEFGGSAGDFCYKVYKKRDSRCEVCPVAQVFDDGGIHYSEEIVSSKKGEPINMLVHATPIRNGNGDIISVMEMSTNITELMKTKTQMTQLGQLVSSLAHTIKGIVTGLEGGMYVVESGFKNKSDESVKKGWEMVQRNIERISHLVLDMLYFAKDRVPEKEEVRLDKLCSEICDLYSKKFLDNNIKLNLDIHEINPYPGDKKSLYTLILTLVENAIHACIWDKEKLSHEVNMKLEDTNGILNFEIADNGLGMAADVRSKLFTTMYSTKGSGGSGFGLMIVKKIVDEHGGEITVESEPGQGARFAVKLKK
jgi:PAS domain S-box-containing protein